MNPDQIYDEAVRSGRIALHPDPSPVTLQFMEMQKEVNTKIDIKLDKLEDKIDAIRESMATLTVTVSDISKDLFEVKTQTQKTNGRVNKLELWRQFIVGGAAVLGIVWAIFQFILPYLLSHKEVTLNDKDYEQIVQILETKN